MYEMAPHNKLIRSLKKELRAAADPEKAPIMRKYMKSEMPYLGIQTPLLRAAVRGVFAAHPILSFEDWRDTVLALWRGAKFREERYAAIGLASHKPYARIHTLEALPMYEEMIVTGAWWDYVDSIATRQLGLILRSFPRPMAETLREWANGTDMWKRRSAIIAQLNFKAETDLELLYDCIRPSLAEREFFLRKAIGWVLRQHARTDPAEVRRYVKALDAQLSPLSKREALKHIA
jgi:3-methyladenine DNA glycosylase AlkD